jgi:hypothetical protein
MAEVKRLNYFNGQFLVEKDFQDEQKYEVDMRRRLNAGLHSFGVVGGLGVTKSGDKQVTIAPGVALNRDGAEIVLTAPLAVDMTPFGANATVFLTIAYKEVLDPADHYTTGGLDNFTRTTERPAAEAKTTAPAGDGTVTPLARIVLDGAGNVPAAIDTSIQTQVTTKLANGSVASVQLANNAVIEAKLADAAVTENKLANNSVTAAKIRDGNVGTAELADGSVTTNKIADLAVTEQKIANNAVTAAKIKDGSVGTPELADNSIPLKKLKLAQAWDSTTTLAANAVAGFNVLAVPLATPRGATLIVSAYTTTNGGAFEWSERSSTGGPATGLFINQGVFFHNLSAVQIEIKFKIWELLPE